MSARIFLLILLLAHSTQSLAAELRPFTNGNKLGAFIKELKFPDNLSKNLTSGLSNKILIRFELMADSHVQLRRIADITIQYDLWDENFKMILYVDDNVPTVKTLLSLKDVLSYLTNLRIPNLCPFTELSQASVLHLKADILLNPIEKEQMEKIRKWVAQNSTAAPLDPTGLGSAKPVSLSRSTTLFNKIFEQYATGTNTAAIWREIVWSNPFRLAEVTREK